MEIGRFARSLTAGLLLATPSFLNAGDVVNNRAKIDNQGGLTEGLPAPLTLARREEPLQLEIFLEPIGFKMPKAIVLSQGLYCFDCENIIDNKRPHFCIYPVFQSDRTKSHDKFAKDVRNFYNLFLYENLGVTNQNMLVETDYRRALSLSK